MDKEQTSQEAIEELEKTGTIEIISKEDEEKDLKDILLRARKRADLIYELRMRGYSEFMNGVITGYTLATEQKIELRRNRRKWIPSIMKKE